jgi:hypothetical protein
MKRMDFTERDEKLKSAFNSAIKSMLKKAYDTAGISKDDFNSFSPEQKMDVYLDAYLSITDDKYSAIDDIDKKNEYRKRKFLELVPNYSGRDISKMPKERLDKLYALTSIKLDYVLSVNNGNDTDIIKSLKDFDNSPFSERAVVLCDYLSKVKRNTDAEENLYNVCKQYLEIKNWMKSNPQFKDKDFDNPDDLKEAIKQMEKEGITVPEEMKKEILHAVRGKKLGVHVEIGAGLDSVAVSKGISRAQVISETTKGINGKNYMTVENRKTIDELLLIANGHPNDIAEIMKWAKDNGIPKEFIEQRINANEELRRMRIARAEDGKETAQHIESALKSGDSAAMADAKRISGIIQEKDYFEDRQDIIDADTILVEHEELREPVAKAIRANYTVEEGSGIVSEILNSTDVSDASAAKFSYTFMDVGDAAENVEYMKHFANTVTRAPAMEGFAAASNTIEDPGLRSQYNAAVESGLANYTPEQQATIRTAMQTGSISQETLSKTSSSSSSSSSQQSSSQNSSSQQSSQQVSAQGTRSGQQSAQASAQNSASQQTAQTSASQTPAQNSAPQQTAQQSAATNRLQQIQALQQQNAQYIEQQRVARLQAADQQRVVEQQQTTEAQKQVDEESRKVEEQIRQGVEADEAFRQEVMAKAKELQEKIQASVEEWEARHRKLTTEDGELVTAGIAIDEANELINNSNLSEKEKEGLKQQVIKASSIEEIYEILIAKAVDFSYVREKVLDLLNNSGSSTRVGKLISEISPDQTLIKEIFVDTHSSGVRKTILSMMSTDTIYELLSNGVNIDYFRTEDSRILQIIKEYITRNYYSLSSTNRAKLMQLLGSADQADIQREFNSTATVEETAQTVINEGFNNSNDSDEKGSAIPGTPETPENPRFAVGEITKRVGNELVTRVGTATVTENASKFKPDEPEIGTAAWKEINGLEDHGLLAFIDNENDESDPNNPNFAQMGDGNRRIPNRGRRSRRNKGINFFS